MIRLELLFGVISIALQIYALIDCARTPQEAIRNLPKWGWLLIVIFFGFIGAIAWLAAGRPKIPGTGRKNTPKMIPPDDNPDFLRNI